MILHLFVALLIVTPTLLQVFAFSPDLPNFAVVYSSVYMYIHVSIGILGVSTSPDSI